MIVFKICDYIKHKLGTNMIILDYITRETLADISRVT